MISLEMCQSYGMSNEKELMTAIEFYKCSECHAKITLKLNYCPFCGTKMEREE